jgi:hypothetical protein
MDISGLLCIDREQFEIDDHLFQCVVDFPARKEKANFESRRKKTVRLDTLA